jgi:hypothetical protein
MSRLSDFMTNNTSQPPVTTVLVAGEAIQSGDVITQGADGLAHVAQDPNTANAFLRPLSLAAPVAMTNVIQYGPVAIGVGSTTFSSSCKLSNGNIATISTGLSGVVAIMIVDQTGAVVLPLTQIGTTSVSAGATKNVAIVTLAGGGFAVAFANGSPSPVVAVYSNAGAVVSAPAIVEARNIFAVQLAALSSGGFAIGYTGFSNPNAGTYCAIYSAIGAVVSAPQLVIDVTGTYAAPLSISALAGGGFVIVGCVEPSSGTNLIQFRRISNTGVLLGALTTALTIPNGPANPICYSVALANGGFSIAGYGVTTTNSYQLAVFDANGTLQGSVISLDTMTPAYLLGEIAIASFLTTSDTVAIWRSGNNAIKSASFSPTGAVVNATANIGTGLVQGSGLSFTQGNGNTIYGSWIDVSVRLAIATFSEPTSISAPVLTLAVGILNSPSCVFPTTVTLNSTFNPLAVVYNGGSVLFAGLYSYSVQKMTLLGVANMSAAQGANVTVQISGTIPLRIPFVQAYAVNAQRNPTPGQRMSFAGNTAVMYGLQADRGRVIS